MCTQKAPKVAEVPVQQAPVVVQSPELGDDEGLDQGRDKRRSRRLGIRALRTDTASSKVSAGTAAV